MQDRFKFKGYWYNDVQKKWWVFDEPEFITGDGTAEIWSNTEGGAYPELPSDAEFHLCQCTGLKDKNGKLIYEGYIVQILGDEIPYVIEFEQDRAMFVIHSEIDKVCCNFDNYSGDDLYVIGNIYENPELLEVNNDKHTKKNEI